MEVLRSLAVHGAAGRAELLVVGSGSSPRVLAGVLRDAGVGADEARHLRLRAAVDPRRLAFARFGAARGVVNTFSWGRARWWDNLRGLLDFPRECCLRGRIPGVNAGDPWQQSATIVLAPVRGGGASSGADAGGTPRGELFGLRESAPGYPALDRDALVAAVLRGLGDDVREALQATAAAPAAAAVVSLSGASTGAAATEAPHATLRRKAAGGKARRGSGYAAEAARVRR